MKQGPWGRLNFDAYAFHARWDFVEVKKLLPVGFYFTILRDPVDYFESMYVYNVFDFHLGMDINQFAKTVNRTWPPRDFTRVSYLNRQDDVSN